MKRHIDLFKDLTRKDGSAFAAETHRRWHEARHYVLSHLPEIEGNPIGPDASRAPHVVVEGTSELMLSVVRHLALVMHYPNFNEDTASPRTRITVLVPGARGLDDLRAVEATLAREEYLCNLMGAVQCACRTSPAAEASVRPARLPYLDIEVELVGVDAPDDYRGGDFRISDRAVADHLKAYPPEDVYTIDIAKAMLANMVYRIGADLDNLPATDNTAAPRYDMALNTFCFKKRRKESADVWDSDSDARNRLSNVFLTDTFESRLRGILGAGPADLPRPPFYKPHKLQLWRYLTGRTDLVSYARSEKAALVAAMRRNLAALSRCEHSRWVTERLIMGTRPLSAAEAYRDETSFGAAREAYRKSLKRRSADPAHIDLCSYADLRRINPADMKFDCLLILAMPHVVAEAVTVKDNE